VNESQHSPCFLAIHLFWTFSALRRCASLDSFTRIPARTSRSCHCTTATDNKRCLLRAPACDSFGVVLQSMLPSHLIARTVTVLKATTTPSPLPPTTHPRNKRSRRPLNSHQTGRRLLILGRRAPTQPPRHPSRPRRREPPWRHLDALLRWPSLFVLNWRGALRSRACPASGRQQRIRDYPDGWSTGEWDAILSTLLAANARPGTSWAARKLHEPWQSGTALPQPSSSRNPQPPSFSHAAFLCSFLSFFLNPFFVLDTSL